MPSRADRPSLDDFILRGIHHERFGNTVAQRVHGMLEDLYGELMTDLAKVDPGAIPRWKDARLQKLAKMVQPLVKKTYGTILRDVNSDMVATAKDEERWLRDLVNRATEKDLMDVALTKGDLKNLATNMLIEGAPSREWWSGQAGAVQDKFMREVRKGVLRGESVDEMARRIRGKPTGNRFSWYTKDGKHRWNVEFEGGVLQANTRDAKALVRTSVQAVAAQTRRESYLANRDVIKGIEQVSTLDNRTTKMCMAYDGEKWEFETEDTAGSLTQAARDAHTKTGPKKVGGKAKEAEPVTPTKKEFKHMAGPGWDEFTEEEREDLIHWQEKDMGQETAYTLLQAMLRGQDSPYVSAGMRPRLETMQRNIDSAMTKAAKHNPVMDVYRGVGDDFFAERLGRNWDEHLDELVGESFMDEGFVATSPWRDIPERFSGAGTPIFKIRTPQNARAVILDETDEYLLDRNTRFIIEEIDHSGSYPVLITRMEQGG